MINLTIDKYKHILISAILTIALSFIFPKYISAIIVLLIGISKELYDKYSGKGCAEWGDLISDIIGIIIGVL